MTDRELLEAAAKAAGIDWIKDCVWIENGFYSPLAKHERISWNPLTEDGDALRLAVKLDMCFGIAPHRVALSKTSLALVPGGHEVSCKHQGDPYAATRRAIVRAAAEIGKDMK